ncbi:MAG: hypothetical protein KatS3mg060_2910 [Dehalococcoidia bacterium]|nr:MAG: hypothetical protein KatS3mg060_2910 [Dehalococcoidia bacterium]
MDIEACTVPTGSSITDVMQAIDRASTGLAVVVDSSGTLTGVVSDGDLRRALVAGAGLDDAVDRYMVREVLVLPEGFSPGQRDALFEQPAFSTRAPRWIPLVDAEGRPRNLVRSAEIATASSVGLSLGRAAEHRPALVTVLGGAGYIGSVLVRQLLAEGYRVRVVDRLFYGRASVDELVHHPRFELVEADVRSLSSLVPALVDSDAVVHLAELVGDPLCAHNPLMTFEINYLATASIALACHYLQINRFVYVSSCSVYGASPEPETILTEDSPLRPVSLYAKLKIESERSIRQLTHGGFSPVILRLGTVFGLSYRPRFDLVVNTFTAQAIHDGSIVVFGGDQWRPHIHVSDVAGAIRRCLRLPLEVVGGQTFNLVAENLTVDELANLVADEVPTATVTRSATVVDRRNYRVSADKARRMLGFSPERTVRDGIREIAAALRAGVIANHTDPRYSNIRAFTAAEMGAAL